MPEAQADRRRHYETYRRIHAEAWVKVSIDGASPAQIERAEQALRDLFARRGVSALQAAEGAFALEGWDVSDFAEEKEPDDDETDAAMAWMDASVVAFEAAMAAACPGHGVRLELQCAEAEYTGRVRCAATRRRERPARLTLCPRCRRWKCAAWRSSRQTPKRGCPFREDAVTIQILRPVWE